MADSGQGFPTPPATASALSGSREAKRRRIQDSSIVGSDVTTSSTSSGGSSWSAERFRVGVPGLQLLPLASTDPPSNSPALLKFRELRPTIHQILHARGVVFRENKTTLVHRTLPDSSPTANDLTILISADWRDDEEGNLWFLAANDVRELLVQSSAQTRNVKVELISWQLTRERRIEIVERGHPLVAAWPTINLRIHQVINGSQALKDNWVSIDALRIGYISEAAYPTPVTILVTVDWGLDRRQWVTDERQIRDLLLEHGLEDVEVLFERGDLYTSAFKNYPPNRPPRGDHEFYTGDYPQQATMGIDFGPEKDFVLPDGHVIPGPTGTIGGYVDLIHPDGNIIKLAVTNYHCVRWGLPGFGFHKNSNGEIVENAVIKGSDIQKADEQGIALGQSVGTLMQFESPSRHKHKFSLAVHEDEIRAYKHQSPGSESEPLGPKTVQEIKALEASRERKIQYFDQEKHKLGNVFLASGYKKRSTMNSVIDLALLKVRSDKEGSNRVPDASLWRNKGLPPPVEVCGEILNGTASCAECEGLGNVYKYGATTGATIGQFNSIKTDVHPSMWDGVGVPYSTEYCFVARPDRKTQFSGRGDSGSFIFTLKGKWVGVLWGGKTVANANDTPLSYITDAQAILDYLGNIKTHDGRRYEARLSTD